jgi:hypothetical protein
VRGACEDSQSTVPNWYDGLVWLVRCVTTARTGEAAGRTMGEEFGAVFGSEATESTELFQMFVTPDEWNRELVEKQERDGFSSR